MAPFEADASGAAVLRERNGVAITEDADWLVFGAPTVGAASQHEPKCTRCEERGIARAPCLGLHVQVLFKMNREGQGILVRLNDVLASFGFFGFGFGLRAFKQVEGHAHGCLAPSPPQSSPQGKCAPLACSWPACPAEITPPMCRAWGSARP